MPRENNTSGGVWKPSPVQSGGRLLFSTDLDVGEIGGVEVCTNGELSSRPHVRGELGLRLRAHRRRQRQVV